MAHVRWGLCQRFCIGAQEFQVMHLPTTIKSSASLVSSTVIHILYFCSDVFDYIQCLWYIISRQPYVHSLPKARSHSWCHPLWIITVIHQFQHTLLFVSITYSTYGCMIMYQDVYLQPSRWSQAFAAARYPHTLMHENLRSYGWCYTIPFCDNGPICMHSVSAPPTPPGLFSNL